MWVFWVILRVFFLKVHTQKSARFLSNTHYFHIQQKWKNIKKGGCRAVFITLPNIYDEAFLRK